MNRRISLALLLAIVVAPAAVAQAPVNEGFLTYRFKQPKHPAYEMALTGLGSFDAELDSVVQRGGDSVALIIAHVRPKSWSLNPEVWGYDSGGEPAFFFGRLQTYLEGNPRFRILVRPAACIECKGALDVVFMPISFTNGYLVGGGKPLRAPSPPKER